MLTVGHPTRVFIQRTEHLGFVRKFLGRVFLTISRNPLPLGENWCLVCNQLRTLVMMDASRGRRNQRVISSFSRRGVFQHYAVRFPTLIIRLSFFPLHFPILNPFSQSKIVHPWAGVVRIAPTYFVFSSYSLLCLVLDLVLESGIRRLIGLTPSSNALTLVLPPLTPRRYGL